MKSKSNSINPHGESGLAMAAALNDAAASPAASTDAPVSTVAVGAPVTTAGASASPVASTSPAAGMVNPPASTGTPDQLQGDRLLGPAGVISLILAAAFTGLIVAGTVIVSLRLDDNVAGLPHTHERLHALLRTGLISGLVAFLLSGLVFAWAERVSRRSQPKNDRPWRNRVFGPSPVMGFFSAFKKYGWIFFLLILLAWIPYICLTWPGVLRDDTLAQFFQSQGVRGYYTRHPLMGTFIFGLFWRLGQAWGHVSWGLGAYTVVQAIGLAFDCSLVLVYLRKRGAPLIFLWLVTLFFACSYPIVASIPTMSKDSLWALVMTPLSLIFIEACLTRGKVLKRLSVLLTFVILAFLFLAIKRTGVEILLFSGFFLTVLTLASHSGGKAGLAVISSLLLPLVLANALWAPLSQKVTGATTWSPVELYGLFTQPLARLERTRPEAMTKEEKAEVNRYMDLATAADRYNLHREDETMYTANSEALEDHKVDFVLLAARIGLKNKGNAATFLMSTLYVWRPWLSVNGGVRYPMDSGYIFSPSYMSQWGREVHSPLNAYETTEDLRAEGRLTLESESWWRRLAVATVTARLDLDSASQPVRRNGFAVCMRALRSQEVQENQQEQAVLDAAGPQVRFERQPVKALSEKAMKETCLAEQEAESTVAAQTQGGDGLPWDSSVRSLALYTVFLPLGMGLFLLFRRRWAALTAWTFLAAFVIQLFLSPAALTWYAIPLFFVLPAFVGLIFEPKAAGRKTAGREKVKREEA